MKAKLLTIALITAALASPFAMADDASMQMGPTSSTQQSQVQDESGLLGWLVVLNNAEIDAGNEVLKRKKLNPLVKAYAQYLVRQHTELLKDTMRVSKKINIKPVDGDQALALQKDAQSGLDQLKSLDDQGIQIPYIDAMVNGHTQALAALTEDIQNEKNPAIKALLKVTAQQVKIHLEKAKAIQKKLGG